MFYLVCCIACIGFWCWVRQMHAWCDGWSKIGAVVIRWPWLRRDFSEWCIVQDCRVRVVVMAELAVLWHWSTRLIRNLLQFISSFSKYSSDSPDTDNVESNERQRLLRGMMTYRSCPFARETEGSFLTFPGTSPSRKLADSTDRGSRVAKDKN